MRARGVVDANSGGCSTISILWAPTHLSQSQEALVDGGVEVVDDVYGVVGDVGAERVGGMGNVEMEYSVVVGAVAVEVRHEWGTRKSAMEGHSGTGDSAIAIARH